MDLHQILTIHENFKEKRLKDRFFKHQDIVELLEQLPQGFEVKPLGNSVLGKSINLVKIGTGKTKVMLWSQMHGDEATGTMAIFDLFNFLKTESIISKLLTENCELFFLPMVNPDGATAFTRRNAQQIDINRDYLRGVSNEAQILKQCRNDINPDFGFNLHDQLTTWSVKNSLKPATLSFLAPAFNEQLDINGTRQSAMLVIADIFNDLKSYLPGHIGLFDDEYEPRAFGDNFQKAGTSTILIEAGGFKNDFEKQEIRKYYFGAMLSGLISIASKSYEKQNLTNYNSIPPNNKQIFHYLIHNLDLNNTKVSIGINYDENPLPDGSGTTKTFVIQDLGDLTFCNGYHVFEEEELTINGEIVIFKNANFQLVSNGEIILAFENGELL